MPLGKKQPSNTEPMSRDQTIVPFVETAYIVPSSVPVYRRSVGAPRTSTSRTRIGAALIAPPRSTAHFCVNDGTLSGEITDSDGFSPRRSAPFPHVAQSLVHPLSTSGSAIRAIVSKRTYREPIRTLPTRLGCDRCRSSFPVPQPGPPKLRVLRSYVLGSTQADAACSMFAR